MSIEQVEMFKVVCDEPGCNVDTFDVNGEFSAWAEQAEAIDDWTSAGCQFSEGVAYCEAHKKPFCDGCDAYRSSVDDDSLCPECAESSTQVAGS